MIGEKLCDAFEGLEFLPAQRATMRDGTQLVADVYQPKQDGHFPVLLMRQPYGRDIASTVVYAHPTWYARQGFVVVIQDVRGRGDSEGEFYPFRNEQEDGFDTVAWAAALPKSNGRVGMYGFSYQGSTQLLAALARPPALRALAPHMTAFDLYSGWFYRDGILQLSTTLGWANQLLREDARRRGAQSARALDESWTAPGRLSTQFPLAEAAPITAADLPSYGRDWIVQSQPDGYWEEFDLRPKAGRELQLPMFHLSGWYDTYLRGSVDGYCTMATASPHQFLLAAPWVHIPWGHQLGGTDLGPEAIPHVDEMMARWFHYWLDSDTPTGAPPMSGARYFVLGENRWRESPQWPPTTTSQVWYLHSKGRANSRFGDGALAPSPKDSPEDLFNYDPEVPVVAPGGNQAGQAAFGPHDLSPQQQGLNLLVYTSHSFIGGMVIAGAPTCHLHVRSSAPETHFVARLSRVFPDGRAIFLTLGATVACAQTGAEITIRLDPIAVRIAPGEHLRLDISSSAFPLLVRHPNTATNPVSLCSPAEFQRALQVVYHDTARPSRLELPVLPATGQ